MTSIDLKLDGDGCWPDLGDFTLAELDGVALLPDASAVDSLTGERKRVPALTLRLHLPDGHTVLAQVKVEMLNTILRGVHARLEYLAELARRGGTPS